MWGAHGPLLAAPGTLQPAGTELTYAKDRAQWDPASSWSVLNLDRELSLFERFTFILGFSPMLNLDRELSTCSLAGSCVSAPTALWPRPSARGLGHFPSVRYAREQVAYRTDRYSGPHWPRGSRSSHDYL